MSRSFTIDSAEIKFDNAGRYMGDTPMVAAKKAARKLFKESSASKKRQIRFTIRETTRGSDGEKFEYIGLKEKLDEPKVIKIAGREVRYEFSYKVKACM